MGKRARAAFRAADQKAAASKRRPTTAASRRQHDNDVDARMDAVTAEQKRSQPRVTRVDKESKTARGRRQREDDEEEAHDEVDAFMQQRDRIALDADDDERDDEMEDEDEGNARILDLPDDEEAEDEDDEQEDEEELDEDELYAEEPEDAFRPLPVDDILGEDDEQRRQRSLREEERLTTAWGKEQAAVLLGRHGRLRAGVRRRDSQGGGERSRHAHEEAAGTAQRDGLYAGRADGTQRRHTDGRD